MVDTVFKSVGVFRQNNLILEIAKMATFEQDPRAFALELVENQLVTANHLLLCALKYMSACDVQDMLDSNELSPRFSEDDEDERCIDCGGDNIDEGTCLDCEINDWLESIDDGDHDIEAMRIDIANNNLNTGDDEKAEEYRHENIVKASIVNGNHTQAKEQCVKYGLDYNEMVQIVTSRGF